VNPSSDLTGRVGDSSCSGDTTGREEGVTVVEVTQLELHTLRSNRRGGKAAIHEILPFWK
jgi:hypothetical protein